MRILRVQFSTIVLAALAGSSALYPASAQSVVRQVAQSCAKELQTFCKDVTAGEGRVASCLYAYEDKLTLGCAVAVYQGILELETATARLEMYANECDSDLLQHCADVVPGQGNLYQCLAKNKAKLTEGCAAGVARAEPELRKLGIVK